jgi:hypothetical protein
MAPPPNAWNPAVSAPGLSGPVSILQWPTSGKGSGGRRKPRPFSHVHLEIDLEPEIVREPGLPFFRQVEALLREREIVEARDLLRLTAGVLHALSAFGFRRVDHWEVDPGGWLPLPEASHARIEEPVGHFLRALESEEWKGLSARRSFSVRVSGLRGLRADFVARRIHRERRHSLSVDLWGTIPAGRVKDLVAALHGRLKVMRASLTEYSYARRAK